MTMSRQKRIEWGLDPAMGRRRFLQVGAGSLIGAGLVLGTPPLFGQEGKKEGPPPQPQTNVADALKVPRTKTSLPGPCPGRVVEVVDRAAMAAGRPDARKVSGMVERGITGLTGRDLGESFHLLFDRRDVVGIKVNPVGAGLISTHLEVVDALVAWLRKGGIPARNIVIWDRFDYMLADAGFTAARFPGVTVAGLQTMDEAAAEGKSTDNSRWRDAAGHHVSEKSFDPDCFYFAEVDAPQDEPYLNQHVFNGRHSFFGKLLTQRLTKIINVPVFKNTGNGVSMATKCLGYGAICNTGRLHKPLFFDVCTEVLAFPVIRDKLVLNVTDALKGQYDGGPGPLATAIYTPSTLYFATDPFALDAHCHAALVAKRKEMKVTVNEHPRYTEYLRYAERLGLGIADPARIDHRKVTLA